MEDYIISGMAAGNEIRYVAAYTKGTVETARATHDLSPVCTAALGRLLTAGAMMGAMCKNETDVLTLRIKGDGPIDSITVTANAQAEVKGLVRNNHVDIPPRADGHLDVGSAVGHGILTVIRDEGIGEPYVGQTNLVTGEIAEDITYYYAESEQIPTTVGLGVLTGREVPVLQAGGFIIQLLPFASEETISKLEKSLADFSSVTDVLNQGKTIEEMIDMLIGKPIYDTDITIEKKIPTAYKCNCSRERVSKALISIGAKELKSIIDDGKPINMHCDFCNSDYEFSIEDILSLLENAQPQ